MKRTAAALALIITAQPVWAYTPDRAEMMISAVRANECAMAAPEAADLLVPLGLDGDEVQLFVDILYSAGLLTISDDGQELTLAHDLCDADAEATHRMVASAFAVAESAIELEEWRPEFTAEQGAILVGAVRGNGCVLADANAQALLEPLGFEPIVVRDIVTILVETEQATVSNDGLTLSLGDALCAGDPADDPATIEALLAAWTEMYPPAEGME